MFGIGKKQENSQEAEENVSASVEQEVAPVENTEVAPAEDSVIDAPSEESPEPIQGTTDEQPKKAYIP